MADCGAKPRSPLWRRHAGLRLRVCQGDRALSVMGIAQVRVVTHPEMSANGVHGDETLLREVMVCVFAH